MLIKEELPACPVATTVQMIGSKWKLLIMRNLLQRPWRFNELKKARQHPLLGSCSLWQLRCYILASDSHQPIVRFRFFGNDIKSMKTSSLSNCSDRLDAFYSFDFLYSVPQISIASIMGRMDSPRSERAYSTLGGTSG